MYSIAVGAEFPRYFLSYMRTKIIHSHPIGTEATNVTDNITVIGYVSAMAARNNALQ